MCTNFVLIKKNGVSELADRLKIDADVMIYGDFRAGSEISIILEDQGRRQVRPAVWWLYLQQTPNGLKPHSDYFSVNTNYKKLLTKNEYRTSRCIVPVTSFTESQDGKNPHILEPQDGSAMAFGGLYREWTDKTTGEIVTSASVITLAGHPALENIHKKSTPLWLSEEAYDSWLSQDISEIEVFNDLLTPTLRTNLTATPIDKVSTKNTIGDAVLITSTS